jgi:predicted ATP-dependent protease
LVLPVGGIKEKVLAARRAGLKRVILPSENKSDLRELPDNVRDEMQFVLVDRIDQVLAAVLTDERARRDGDDLKPEPRKTSRIAAAAHDGSATTEVPDGRTDPRPAKPRPTTPRRRPVTP